jgi:hypothetical protein
MQPARQAWEEGFIGRLRKTWVPAHDWGKDCEKCSACGKTRAASHNWGKDCDECSACGKTRVAGHDWSKDCERCSACGKTRVAGHDWSKDCGQCSACGKTRAPGHKRAAQYGAIQKCPACGKTWVPAHDWGKDCENCSACGKTRVAGHDWGKDCKRCSACGKTRVGAHDWGKDCEKCSACGKTRLADHDWGKDCEKCSTCGKTRTAGHKWAAQCGAAPNPIHETEDGRCRHCGGRKTVAMLTAISFDVMLACFNAKNVMMMQEAIASRMLRSSVHSSDEELSSAVERLRRDQAEKQLFNALQPVSKKWGISLTTLLLIAQARNPDLVTSCFQHDFSLVEELERASRTWGVSPEQFVLIAKGSTITAFTNPAVVPSTLTCRGCTKVYRIGEDAVAACLEFGLGLASGLVAYDGDGPEREDLVSTLERASPDDLQDARKRALASWDIIQQSLTRGEPRRWACRACSRINSYV